MDNIKTVYELAWLTTQQVVVTTDKEGNNIKSFGSGFFFQYEDTLFFVTADHVLHSDDFEEGLRLGTDDYLWVLNNINSTTELSTMLTPIFGLFTFDMMNFNDELSLEIPDMKDIALAILPNTFFNSKFLTHDLKVEDEVIVDAGVEKKIIDCSEMLKKGDLCLIEGCVKWKKKGVILSRANAIYQNLKFKGYDNKGYYILKYERSVKYEDWAGLSGGPVFNDKAKLIGMAIEVNVVEDTICVIPIEKIMKLMNYAIKINQIK